MARIEILSHWSKLIENLEISSMVFYGSVQNAIKRRKVPISRTRQVTAYEGGIFSASRVYLRVQRGRIAFDICAAPFGTGYFFSSWLVKIHTRIGILIFLAFLVAGFFMWLGSVVLLETFRTRIFNFSPGLSEMLYSLGSLSPIALGFLEFVVLSLLLGFLINIELIPGEDTVLDTPIIGFLYERIYHPVTYYKMDTAQMFQSSIHSAVMEVMDEMTNAKGLRCLTELERKPVMKEFYQK